MVQTVLPVSRSLRDTLDLHAPDELFAFIFELQLVETVVDASLGQQLLMRARFAQLAVVQDEDAIHVLNGREAVCDRNRRPSAHDHPQRVANEQLGFGIDTGRRFVEHEHRWIESERARKREELFLPDGECRTSLGDRCIETGR